MAILTLPIEADSEAWAFKTNTIAFESVLDNTVQTSSLTGGKWRASLTFSSTTAPRMRALRAFLMALEGQAGRFYLSPSLYVPGGDVLSSDLGQVMGAGQTGSALTTDGWTNSTLLFKAGDFVEINGELKVVTADCSSGGTGIASISFKPELRTSPPDNQPLVVAAPRCIMKLTNDEQAEWQLSLNTTFAVSFTCEEAI